MKRKLGLSLSISVVFLSLTSGILASIAWYNTTNSITVDVNGSVVEEYFHTGDGSSAHPYVITRPIHFYHLVEFFQRETTLPPSNDFGTDYLYFQVGYDLDNDGDLEVYNYDDAGTYLGTSDTPSYSNTLNMAYYSNTNALMPIGTNEVPFIGSFDGKADEGIVISNLNIHCAETVIVGHQSVNRASSDIGIFGYVADKDSENAPTIIKNSNFNGLTIDLSDVSNVVNSSTTSIVHTSTHAGHAYVGYIAGHVHTYINYSSTGPTNASPLYNVYVNNATIVGGAGARCDYGYIGLVDTNGGVAPTSVSEQVSSLHGEGGGGQGDNWGGSIAFDAFNQRLYHHLSTANNIRFKNGNSTYTNGLIRTESDSDSAITVYRGGNASTAATYLSQDPASNYVVYNMIGSGTHSINNKQNNSGTTYTATQSVTGTYEPLIINSDYTVADKNTGYLTSSQYTQNGSSHYYNAIDGTVRSASYPNGQIANSLDDTYHNQSSLYNGSTGGPKFTYDGSKLEILTNSSASYGASNYRLVSDDFNSNHTVVNSALTSYTKTNYETLGLTRYKSARAQLETILSSSSYVHGIHFMGEAPVYNKTVSVPNAIINSVTKTNYPVLLSAVDFNVKEAGYITLFAGAYYPATQTTIADSFFDLYVVNRGANDAISSIQKVYKIYKNNTTGAYTYTSSANQTVSGATLMFDMSYLTSQPPKNNVAYYFEIPVDAGEFAIGAVSGKTAGAYLMYLDLGTNGVEEEPTFNEENSVADAPLFTQIDFQINDFVINSCFNIAYVIPNGSTKETFGITVSCGTVTIESNSYTCYELNITNTSGNPLTLNALLMDNDNNNDNDYFYMYAITYNGGARTQYFRSNTYVGASGATSMTPAFGNS